MGAGRDAGGFRVRSDALRALRFLGHLPGRAHARAVQGVHPLRGVFALDFPVFLLASFSSRGLRFFAVAALVWKFGAPVTAFVDRYFNVLTVVFGALLVLGFILVGTLL